MRILFGAAVLASITLCALSRWTLKMFAYIYMHSLILLEWVGFSMKDCERFNIWSFGWLSRQTYFWNHLPSPFAPWRRRSDSNYISFPSYHAQRFKLRVGCWCRGKRKKLVNIQKWRPHSIITWGHLNYEWSFSLLSFCLCGWLGWIQLALKVSSHHKSELESLGTCHNFWS